MELHSQISIHIPAVARPEDDNLPVFIINMKEDPIITAVHSEYPLASSEQFYVLGTGVLAQGGNFS